jgi:hypothetical protein
MGALAFFSTRMARRTRTCAGRAVAGFACAGLLWAACATADSVYRWVDEAGVKHISSVRPPGNIKAERIELGHSYATRRSAAATGTPHSAGAAAKITPAQATERAALLAHLRERECVYALESLDRLNRGAKTPDPAERQRLQQTVNLNCSDQPQRRSEQEALAAKLRVANGADCLEARNQLAAMLEPGRHPQRALLQAQQEFIEAHCTAPVR